MDDLISIKVIDDKYTHCISTLGNVKCQGSPEIMNVNNDYSKNKDQPKRSLPHFNVP